MAFTSSNINSLLYGFFTGVALVFVSFFGLIVALIEFLRPALIPGIDFLRAATSGAVSSDFTVLITAGALLNGIIYAVLFLAISFAWHHLKDWRIRVAAVTAVRHQLGRSLTDAERRLVWDRLWWLLENIKREVTT